MEFFINYSILITGIWLCGTALLINSNGAASKMFFKIIPFFLGLACLFDAAKLFNWI